MINLNPTHILKLKVEVKIDFWEIDNLTCPYELEAMPCTSTKTVNPSMRREWADRNKIQLI